jgi:hypothetical protein
MKPVHKIKVTIGREDEDGECMERSGIAYKFVDEEADPDPEMRLIKISEMFHALMRHEIIKLTNQAIHDPERFKHANRQANVGRPQHALSAGSVPEES